MSDSSQGSKPSDCIRINELTLLLPLASGAQWPTQSGDLPVLQPIAISLSIDHDVRNAAASDDLSQSINYNQIANALHREFSSKTFLTLGHVGQGVCDFVIHNHPESFQSFGLTVTQLKAPLSCNRVSISYSSYRAYGQWRASLVEYVIEDLICPTIIGVNTQERVDRQSVLITCKIRNAEEGIPIDPPDLRDLVKQVFEIVYHSNYLTLEALASSVAKGLLVILSGGTAPVEVTVSASKPRALPLAKSSEIVVTRTLKDFVNPPHHEYRPIPKAMTIVPETVHTAVLALGANMGDRFRNIEIALRLLETPWEVLKTSVPEGGSNSEKMKLDVIDTSFLYETAPMYVTEQPSFINCACVIETNLSPLTLLHLVKTIETTVGRVPSVRNGPRAVDVDILLYDSDVFDTRPTDARQNLDNLEGQLVVPHPRLVEREFVLRPLNDILPAFIHPVLKKPISQLLGELEIPANEPPIEKVVPFPRMPQTQDGAMLVSPVESVPYTLTHWKYGATRRSHGRNGPRTRIMATLNTTPDSFSDGSTHNDLPKALRYVEESISSGASIIDIGGYSTRPGAAFVSTSEEINRTVPFIQQIRAYGSEDQAQSSEASAVRDIPISVDTFRWEVAEAALLAGANCINDVNAFSGPDSYPPSAEDEAQEYLEHVEKMKTIARRYAAPVILMHSRGDAGHNKDYKAYDYVGSQHSVLEGVRIELGDKVDRIVRGKGGVRRWFVIADPGIGFSKTLDDNLELLRNGSQVVGVPHIGLNGDRRNPLFGMPQLIGTSKKSFLGALLGQGDHGRSAEPNERGWATAAAVACAVQQGAFIVRVHDVAEIYDVVHVADALWAK